MILLLLSCVFVGDADLAARLDPDGDGAPYPEDCDPTDASVFPGAEEACDGVDQDCDGEVDEGLGATWFTDADGDLYGDVAVTACAAPAGAVAQAGDCDDGDDDTFPGAAEVCDGEDQDCDGVADDGLLATWYTDGDGDGHGDPATAFEACEAPAQGVDVGDDCDDSDGDVYPGADEADCEDPVDYNCDGSTGRDDVDQDGVVACEDCDDADEGRFPGAEEVCDEIDQDCDGAADDDASDALSWYADADGDAYGDAGSTQAACEVPEGYVADATDCDDADGDAHPGADETCDPGDDDCDGDVDEAATDASTWYADADHDGYGDASASTTACAAAPGWVADDTDCDDAHADANPGVAAESCTTTYDDDCDGATDAVGATACTDWYADADGDGYGAGASVCACVATGSYTVAAGDDCDESDAAVHPDAAETCEDGVDDDCDGADASCSVDRALSAADAVWTGTAGDRLWPAAGGDFDGDGFSDLILGGPYSAAGAGAAWIVRGSGAPASGSVASADVQLSAEASGDSAGRAVAAGDFDGDGDADFAVTAYGNVGNSGRVYLFLGGTLPTSGSLSSADVSYTGGSSWNAGFTMANAGDTNGDGIEDLLIGATNVASGYTGAALLVLGSTTPTSGSLSGADATYTASVANDGTGYALGVGGDVDGDGLDDVLVGAYLDESVARYAGAAHLVLGSSSPSSLTLSSADGRYTGENSNDYAAYAVALADLTGDGYAEMLVGAMGKNSSAGHVYVLAGGASPPASGSLSSAWAALQGVTASDRAGFCLANAGDVDEDGAEDVLVGANLASGGAGATYLVLGADVGGTTTLADAYGEFTGAVAGDNSGSSLANVGDVDADGLDDLLIGAQSDDAGGADAGAVYLLLGSGL